MKETDWTPSWTAEKDEGGENVVILVNLVVCWRDFSGTWTSSYRFLMFWSCGRELMVEFQA